MGGAGTAAGNDSAMPYLNPSGVGGIPGDVFGLSASIYGYTKRGYKSFFRPDGVHSDLKPLDVEIEEVTARSVLQMPTSIMYMSHFGDDSDEERHVVGFSLTIPSADRIDFIADFHARIPRFNGTFVDSVSWTRNVVDYYVGPTYAIEIGEGLRIGASALGLYTRVVDTYEFASQSDLSGGAVSFSNSGRRTQEGNAFALVPVVGAQLEVADYVWVGVAAAAPSLHVGGQGTFSAESGGLTADLDGSPIGFRVATAGRTTNEYGKPWRLNAGIAYDDRDAFSVAADVAVFGERKKAAVTEGVTTTTDVRTDEQTRTYKERQRVTMDLVQVVNASLGAEMAVTDALSVRAGIFSDLAAGRKPKHPDVSDQFRSVYDYYGGTVGVGLRFGSFDTTVGGLYSRGIGTFYALDNLSQASVDNNQTYVVGVDSTVDTVMVLFSGVVTAEEAQRQIDEALPADVRQSPFVEGGREIVPPPAQPSPPASPPPPAPAATTAPPAPEGSAP